jgi:hypothetical protein
MVEKLASSEIAEQALQRVCEGIESNWPMRGWQIADQIRPLLREAERDTRELVAQQQRENVTDLIHIAGAVVRREYLPILERCRTIQDARYEIERYDSRHVDLAMKIKAVAERIRGKE